MYTPVPQARELWVLHFLGHSPRTRLWLGDKLLPGSSPNLRLSP